MILLVTESSDNFNRSERSARTHGFSVIKILFVESSAWNSFAIIVPEKSLFTSQSKIEGSFALVVMSVQPSGSTAFWSNDRGGAAFFSGCMEGSDEQEKKIIEQNNAQTETITFFCREPFFILL